MTKDVDKMELQIESEIENLMNVSSNLLVIITTLSALLASNLLGTAKLLLLVLGLLAKLGRSASLSSSKGLTNEAVLGLVIKSILKGIVDASETSGLLASGALGQSLANLPERQKQVILLYYFEKMSIQEIGEKLGISYRTVVNTKTNGIKNMKANLNDFI